MSLSGTYPVIRFASTDSTNEVAMQLALQGGEHGTVIVAERQAHGRGRGEKGFFSPPGGLYMSIILRPELPAELLPLITLAGGLACARAVAELTDLVVALKWPNDLYLRGRKLGGILAQTAPYSPAAHGIPFVVLGIGINVNTGQESFPPELRGTVTSLYDAILVRSDIDSLLDAIHTHLSGLLPVLRADFAAVLNEWRRRDYLLGREITWQDVRGRTMTGRGAGIRDDGCYQLQGPEGSLHAILAGEVTISAVGEPLK
jgi:BirA family biotin operon repressor/biotin-[acetyl-CoA-carboxylase] ligase